MWGNLISIQCKYVLAAEKSALLLYIFCLKNDKVNFGKAIVRPELFV